MELKNLWNNILFYVDTEKQQFKVGGYRNAANVFDFNQVSSYELVESDHTITSGGLGRSAVGAVAFGGVGAVVGALTGGKKTKKVVENFKIKINLKSIETPVVYVELLIVKTKTNSLLYKDAIEKADNIPSILDYYSMQKENIKTIIGDIELILLISVEIENKLNVTLEKLKMKHYRLFVMLLKNMKHLVMLWLHLIFQ